MASKQRNGSKAPKPKRRAAPKANTRRQAPNVLGQGVGAVPQSAFGSKDSTTVACWDARMPHHLPLPRAVGPYTVTRLTKYFRSTQQVTVFGSFGRCGRNATGQGFSRWSDVAAIGSNGSGLLVSATNAAKVYSFIGAPTDATLCPSAVTVQIMNPEALQTTSGVVYGGVLKTSLPLVDGTSTWEALGESFIQYQAPRLMSAGKLALRGVQMSSFPLNMAPLSEFTSLEEVATGVTTLDDATTPISPMGFAPMMVYNPDGVDLEFLVTTEYRTRFPLENVASATHHQHPVASDSLWSRLTAHFASKGPGIEDIPDVIANVGRLVSVGRAAYGALNAGAEAAAPLAILG